MIFPLICRQDLKNSLTKSLEEIVADGFLQKCPCGSHADIYRTRLLCDDSFSSELSKEILRYSFSHHAYTKTLMNVLLAGGVLTGARCSSAGITENDHCQACGRREDHQHLFQSCPFYSATRPMNSLPKSSWCCGVIPEPNVVQRWRGFVGNLPLLPERSEVYQPASPIFVDGSCFFHKWMPLSTAAAALHIPGQASKAFPLPGLQQTSQRAEIYALILASSFSARDVVVYSDCSNVVNTAHFLASHGLDPQCLGRLDHKDLWTEFCNAAKNSLGSFVVYKVKSHVSKGDHSQDPFLSINNDYVDGIAKNETRRIRNLFYTDAIEDLKTSMALHAHQVATLKLRASEFCAYCQSKSLLKSFVLCCLLRLFALALPLDVFVQNDLLVEGFVLA